MQVKKGACRYKGRHIKRSGEAHAEIRGGPCREKGRNMQR
jgi:hypothetical protein